MKNIRIILILTAVLFTINGLEAQTEDKKWSFGAGVYFADFVAPQLDFPEQITDAYWNYKGLPVEVSFGRYLSKRLNLVMAYSMVELDNPSLPTDKTFWQTNLGLQLKLIPDSWVEPFLYANGGYATLKGDGSFVYNGGLGFNIWIAKTVGVYAKAAYSGIPQADDSDYTVFNEGTAKNYKITDNINYAFGLKFSFGKPKDTDGDKVPDKEDKCPETYGLASTGGCPDSDQDGIIDKEDACPQEAGPEKFNGCPDRDDDGIIDRNDDCPDEAGLAAFNGCPDTDQDGVPDKDDDCPDMAGLKDHNGCPDSDGDGIIDPEDDCPFKKGTADNKGCPVVKPKIAEAVEIDRAILFDLNKAEIKTEYIPVLDEVVAKLKAHPEVNIKIEGYTDSLGGESYNLRLSDRRAAAVREYLLNAGIKPERISSVGYGEDHPVADNKMDDGRKQNRRAVISTY